MIYYRKVLGGIPVAKNRFSIQDGKNMNPDRMQGRLTALERMEHPVTFKLSESIPLLH